MCVCGGIQIFGSDSPWLFCWRQISQTILSFFVIKIPLKTTMVSNQKLIWTWRFRGNTGQVIIWLYVWWIGYIFLLLLSYNLVSHNKSFLHHVFDINVIKIRLNHHTYSDSNLNNRKQITNLDTTGATISYFNSQDLFTQKHFRLIPNRFKFEVIFQYVHMCKIDLKCLILHNTFY